MAKKFYGILLVIFLLCGVGLYANYVIQQDQPEIVGGGAPTLYVCVGETKTYTKTELEEILGWSIGDIESANPETCDEFDSSVTTDTVILTGKKTGSSNINIKDTNAGLWQFQVNVTKPQFTVAQGAKGNVTKEVLANCPDNNGAFLAANAKFSYVSSIEGEFETALPDTITFSFNPIETGFYTIKLTDSTNEKDFYYTFEVKEADDITIGLTKKICDKCDMAADYKGIKDNFGNVTTQRGVGLSNDVWGTINNQTSYKNQGLWNVVYTPSAKTDTIQCATVKVEKNTELPDGQLYMNWNLSYRMIIDINSTGTGLFAYTNEGEYKDVTWSSSDNDILSFDETGKPTAIKVGRVTITATDNKNSDNVVQCDYFVIAFSYIAKGKSEDIKSITTDTGKSLRSWNKLTSEDDNIVKVTEASQVYKKEGVSKGITRLKATVDQEEYYQTISCYEKFYVAEGKTVTLTKEDLTKLSEQNQYVYPLEYNIKELQISAADFDPSTGIITLDTSAGTDKRLQVICGNTDSELLMLNYKFDVVQAPTSLKLNKHLKAGSINNINKSGLSLKPTIEGDCKEVIWTSSDPEILSFDETGKATAHKTGHVTITCQSAVKGVDLEKLTDSCELFINSSIAVNKDKVSNILQIAADDGTIYETWTDLKSLDPNIVEVIDNNNIIGVSQGNTKLSFKDSEGNVHYASVSCFVRKKLKVGETVKYTVNDFSNMYDKYNNTGIPTKYGIDSCLSGGNLKDGEVEIDTSKVNDDLKVSIFLKDDCDFYVQFNYMFDVYNPVTDVEIINAPKNEIPLGTPYTLEATVTPYDATYKTLKWTSSNTDVATIDEETGEITTLAEGKTTITCTAVDDPDAEYDTCVVNVYIPVESVELVEPSTPIEVGTRHQLKTIILPENATYKSVTYKSSNTKVATVDANGVVLAKSNGKATITVKTKDGGYKATCKVECKTSVKKVTLSEKKLYMNVGEQDRLYATINPNTASDNSVKWVSSDSSIAYVSQIGKVYSKGRGTATITVITRDGSKKDYCKVYVTQQVKSVKLNKSKEELFLGDQDTLVATVLPENANNKDVVWSSSDSSIVSVSQNGRIKGKGLGTATITVTTKDGGYTSTCKVTVVQPVTGVVIAKEKISIKKGAKEQILAVVLPSNAKYKDVIWSSSNPSNVSVDKNGMVKGLKSNSSAYIKVTTVDGGYTDKILVYVK